MKIGITFDLKASMPAGPDVPDDAYEEFDKPQTIDIGASLWLQREEAAARFEALQAAAIGDPRPNHDPD